GAAQTAQETELAGGAGGVQGANRHTVLRLLGYGWGHISTAKNHGRGGCCGWSSAICLRCSGVSTASSFCWVRMCCNEIFASAVAASVASAAALASSYLSASASSCSARCAL